MRACATPAPPTRLTPTPNACATPTPPARLTPTPNASAMMTDRPNNARTRSRLKMFAVMLVFILPLVLAFVLYYNADWLAPASASRGTLLQPIRTLPDAFTLDVHNAGLQQTTTQGRELFTRYWTLVKVDNGDCDLACEADLFKLRQLRQSLGRDRQRVKLMYLSPAAPKSAHFHALLSRHPRLTVADWRSPPQLYQQLFADANASVYLLDPLGNIVLYYTAQASAKDILKDVKKLLKVSKIG